MRQRVLAATAVGGILLALGLTFWWVRLHERNGGLPARGVDITTGYDEDAEFVRTGRVPHFGAIPREAFAENAERVAAIDAMVRRGLRKEDAPLLLRFANDPVLNQIGEGPLEGYVVVHSEDASFKAKNVLNRLGSQAVEGLAALIRTGGLGRADAFEYLVRRGEPGGIDAMFAADQSRLSPRMKEWMLSVACIEDDLRPDGRTWDSVREWWVRNRANIVWRNGGFRLRPGTQPTSGGDMEPR